MLDTGACLVEACLQPGDFSVEQGDLGGDVSLPALLGLGFASRPHRHFFAADMTISSAGAVLSDPLSPLLFGSRVGQGADGLPSLGALPHTPPGVQLGAGSSGCLQGLFDLAQCGGPVGQADADDGGARPRLFGMDEGGNVGLLVGWKSLEPLTVEGGGLGNGGVDRPRGGTPGSPVVTQVVDGLGQVVGHAPHVGGFAGPREGHVGEFSAAAVGEQMSPVRRRSLAAMDRCRVSVAEAVPSRFLFAERHVLAIVGA